MQRLTQGGGTLRALRRCHGEDVRMAKADYRTKAGECYRMAALAPGPADQATWLKLAAEWLVLKQRQPRAASDRLQIASAKQHSDTMTSDYLSRPVAEPHFVPELAARPVSGQGSRNK